MNEVNYQNAVQMMEGVYAVGVKDWNRRLFDALIPLPKGTSYNSYLIIGNDKKALIDTVNPGFEKEWEQKIIQKTNLSEIDYLVMNHAEPDHAGGIPYFMEQNKKAKLVTSRQGAKMAQTFYDVPLERIIIVKDKETLDLGGKTLEFIEAPMLHWPETIFTYIQEDKILFPCDFFGLHNPVGVYSDEVEDVLVDAQRYFGEIMMPFRMNAQKGLEKLLDYDVKIIAPSHGPIHRFPDIICNAYRKWANGETKQKVLIVYATMWTSTEKMLQPLIQTLMANNIEVVVYNLAVSDIGNIAKDMVDSRAIVLAAPTVLGGMHPLAVYAAYLVRALRPPTKFGVVLSSYGWGGGALKQAQEILAPYKFEVVGALEINGPPKEKDLERIVEIAKNLSSKIKECGP
jgi:flavorubredoxin